MHLSSLFLYVSSLTHTHTPTEEEDEDDMTTKKLLEGTCEQEVPVESGYKGPHLATPLTTDSIHMLVEAFKKKKVGSGCLSV